MTNSIQSARPSQKPLIGIPTYSKHIPLNERPQYFLFHSYVKAVEAGGGVPILIPLNQAAEDLQVIVDRLDGIMLAGGDDVNPARYGETPHEKTEVPDNDRDATEIWLAQYAMQTGKPFFGICRGMQVLNVAAGGTLIQDIPSTVPNALTHSVKLTDYHQRANVTHRVQIDPGTRLASICGTDAGVNSFHHQGLDAVPDSLVKVACAADGVVEGVEGRNPDKFLLAVQWHPENMTQTDPKMLGLFQAFVQFIQTH